MRPIDWLAVTILLLFAAGLRIIGISFGQPNPEYFPSYAPYGMVHEQIPIQPDEFLSVSIPVNMALRNRLNPEFFNYPSFIINANFVLFHLTGSLNGLSLDDRVKYNLRVYAGHHLYFIARMFSVAGGMITLACCYATARILAGRFAALCAGLLVASCFTFVQHAHYIKPGSLATGWMTLAAWLAVVSLFASRRARQFRFYILAAAATGLAATTRYNALAVAPFVFAIGLAMIYRYRSRGMLRAFVAAWLTMPLVFFVGSPYILRDFEHFMNDLFWIVGQYVSTGISVPQFLLVDHWTGMFHLLLFIPVFGVGAPAVLCAFASIAACWRRGRWQSAEIGKPIIDDSFRLNLIFLWLTVILYTLIALRTVRPGRSDHHIMLILPFVILLSALGADWIRKNFKLTNRIAMPALALILVIQPLVLSVQFVKMVSQPDTRIITLDWIHKHVPKASRFFLNGPYNVPLDESMYPNTPQYLEYAPEFPNGDQYDYMIYSDALAFDILRSGWVVPPEVIDRQREYLERLDESYNRVAEIQRPHWIGSDAIMYSASYWHNPTLILYCLNQASCENHR
jgi:hypothetical protein